MQRGAIDKPTQMGQQPLSLLPLTIWLILMGLCWSPDALVPISVHEDTRESTWGRSSWTTHLDDEWLNNIEETLGIIFSFTHSIFNWKILNLKPWELTFANLLPWQRHFLQILSQLEPLGSRH